MSGTDAEAAAFGLSFLIELIKKRPKAFLAILALASIGVCTLVFVSASRTEVGRQAMHEVLSDEPGAAEITFVSLSDMEDWIDNTVDLRWGIAISSPDITLVREKDGEIHSEPNGSIEDFGRFAVASGIQTGEKITLRIEPGRYDWLIIMDHDNDGSWDSYLGSIEKDIKLNDMQFDAFEAYDVVVGVDSIPRLHHTTGDLSTGE